MEMLPTRLEPTQWPCLRRRTIFPFTSRRPSPRWTSASLRENQIPIEQRPSREVTHIQQSAIAPEGVQVANPAFDVTPNRYVTAIITERGVARAPYEQSLKTLALD